jgi:hypothetical protein
MTPCLSAVLMAWKSASLPASAFMPALLI